MPLRSRLAAVAVAAALMGLTACGPNAQSTAAQPTSTAGSDAAYCDAVRDLAAHMRQFQTETVSWTC